MTDISLMRPRSLSSREPLFEEEDEDDEDNAEAE